MAKQIDFTDDSGTRHPMAYVMVVGYQWYKFPQPIANYRFNIYHDKAARVAERVAVVGGERSISIQGPQLVAFFPILAMDQPGMNPIRACYLYMNTLPEFAGSVDV